MNDSHMLEIPFVPQDKSGLGPRELTAYLRDRFPEMASIAVKLIESGSPIKLTAGGVAFQPSTLPVDTSEDPDEVAEQLKPLGIHEQVRAIPSRSFAELQSAEKKLADHVDYDQLDSDFRNLEHPLCSCCQEDKEEQMTKLEQQYGRRHLLVPNDYERGVLHGKLEAIRWVLGDEWEDPERRVMDAKIQKLMEAAENFELVAHIRDHLASDENDCDATGDDADAD